MHSTPLYFLHGFGGCAKDWEPVIHYLPEHRCFPLCYPFDLPTTGVLIGYSMGGRIALSSSLPKIVISGHPGLEISEEKEQRLLKEREWIHRLRTCSLAQFFNEWYAQPLFSTLKTHPLFPSILARRLEQPKEQLIHQLEKHSLTHQNSLLENGVFLQGALDLHYGEIYRKRALPFYTIPAAGHACHLENPQATAHIIKIIISNIT